MEPRVWIWSDLHLKHANCIEYEKRPFADVEQMDRALLGAWRSTVKKGDTIINLGDVTWYPNTQMQETLASMPGLKKILVLGNHDRGKSLDWWRKAGFHEVYPYPIIYNNFFILSHEPVYVGPGMPYVNIHGHTHSESSTNRQKINVSVEQTGYKPLLLRDLMAPFMGREEGEML